MGRDSKEGEEGGGLQRLNLALTLLLPPFGPTP